MPNGKTDKGIYQRFVNQIVWVLVLKPTLKLATKRDKLINTKLNLIL